MVRRLYDKIIHELSEWIIVRIDSKPYTNLPISPACICTLCIVRYLALNIGISMLCKYNENFYCEFVICEYAML